MRTLTIVLFAVGVLLGADEVAVTAAAKTLDSATAAAPLFALWGAGSFVGRHDRHPAGRRSPHRIRAGALARRRSPPDIWR